MDKYELIKGLIVQVDALVDARGAQKCTLVVEIIQKLDALAKGLGEEDRARANEKALLEKQLKALTEPAPLKPGEQRIGGQTYTMDMQEEPEHEDPAE